MNKFNKELSKNYFVNSNNEIIIKGLDIRLILSESEQDEILKDLEYIKIKLQMGESLTTIEKIFIQFFLNKDTY